MPARSVTTEIRDKAERAIADAAAVLSERFGVGYQPVRAEGKDRDYLAAMELSGIAGFLTSLAEAPFPDVQAHEAEVRAITDKWRDAELDAKAAKAELAELKAATAKPATKPKSELKQP